MNREQLAHIVRAASTVTSDGEIIVLGSQSILGTFDEDVLPEEATMSMEADIAFAVDEGATKADQVDGVIGEGSLFQQTFGIYGQGVELSTATLPAGWQGRLISFDRLDAEPATARCLDPHDLAMQSSSPVERRTTDSSRRSSTPASFPLRCSWNVPPCSMSSEASASGSCSGLAGSSRAGWVDGSLPVVCGRAYLRTRTRTSEQRGFEDPVIRAGLDEALRRLDGEPQPPPMTAESLPR